MLGHLLVWHRDSVGPLIDLALPHITHGSIIVDYGTGTGASAIELLKKLDGQEMSVKMILVDPLVSWFSKAWDLLGDGDDVHFELSILTTCRWKHLIQRPTRNSWGKEGRCDHFVIDSASRSC